MIFWKRKSEERGLKKQMQLLKNTPLFDRTWYLAQYPDLEELVISPEEHYLTIGWREGRAASQYFSTTEYLNLHPDVREKGICPLLHYEMYGKYEGRHYCIQPERELADYQPTPMQKEKYEKEQQRKYKKEREYYNKLPVIPNKIIFKTFQMRYTCNLKYICEELIRQKIDCDMVWLCKKEESHSEDYPHQVRLVPMDTAEAREEIASAGIIMDNGSMLFNNRIAKKSEQVGICTWHGSLGFKKLGIDTIKNERGMRTIRSYEKNHDILISNSQFETNVYRSSYWPHAEILMYGHARNDLLVRREKNCNDPMVRRVRSKVYHVLGLPEDVQLALYAPTFRETMVQHATNYVPEEILERGSYALDDAMVLKALKKRFGGKWVLLVRHHFVNKENKVLQQMESDLVVDVTDYSDIQELLAVIEVGITDYSSWILDYLLTGRPGFLYTTDENKYEEERGLYYPLETSPFSVAKTMEELIQNIESFSMDSYLERRTRFLRGKGCIEDGNASRRIVKKLQQIMNKDVKEDETQQYKTDTA